MTTMKRRGRPRGTDYKEDAAALALVADIIIAHPGTQASTAMRQVQKGRQWRGASPNAIVARWLRKWRAEASTQLHLARERGAPRPSPKAAHDIFASAARTSSIIDKHAKAFEAIARMQKAANDPALRAWITGKFPGSALTPSAEFLKQAEQMRKAMESPAVKAMAELMKSPAVVKQMEFMRNYMQRVRIAEEVLPKLPNFNSKLF
ncbi:hypothetical protein ACQR1N_31115 [Bradyrhizobium sp. HKCCYLRH1073]|uniref:hypothetical protein n=1 Tax=unclassified Bradyrhizobium TaxID=2631580 RepID=UPI003EB8DC72